MRQRVTIALATICRPGVHHRGRADDRARRARAEGRARHDPRRPARARLLRPLRDARHGRPRLSDRPPRHHVRRPPGRGGADGAMSSRDRCIPIRATSSRSLPRIGDDTPRKGLEGAPPNLADPPPGCRFHPRCPLAMERAAASAARHSSRSRRTTASPASRSTSREASSRMSALLELDDVVARPITAAACSRRRRVEAVKEVSFSLDAGGRRFSPSSASRAAARRRSPG